MQRFIFLIFVVLLLSSSFSPVPAFALNNLSPSDGPFTVDSPGSTTPKDTFDLSEHPFVFLEFDRDSLNTNLPLLTIGKWILENKQTLGLNFTLTSQFPNDSVRLWSDAINWDLIKKTGKWQVDNSWLNLDFFPGKGGIGSKTINFTVTPEPVASLLFIIGGAPVAFRLYRRRKTL